MQLNDRFLKRLVLGVLGATAATAIACGSGGSESENVEATVAYLEPLKGISYRNVSIYNNSSQKLFLIQDHLERTYDICNVNENYSISIKFEDVDYTVAPPLTDEFSPSVISTEGKTADASIGTFGLARFVDDTLSNTYTSSSYKEFMAAYGGAIGLALHEVVCLGGYDFEDPQFEARVPQYLLETDSKYIDVITPIKPVYLEDVPCFIACFSDTPVNFTPRSY